jgi:hypothetical protein
MLEVGTYLQGIQNSGEEQRKVATTHRAASGDLTSFEESKNPSKYLKRECEQTEISTHGSRVATSKKTESCDFRAKSTLRHCAATTTCNLSQHHEFYFLKHQDSSFLQRAQLCHDRSCLTPLMHLGRTTPSRAQEACSQSEKSRSLMEEFK